MKIPRHPPKEKPSLGETASKRKFTESESVQQENRLAARLSQVTPSHRVPGSGCGEYSSGDVEIDGLFFVEAKTIEKGTKSFRITIEMINKLVRQAAEKKLKPALAISYPDTAPGVPKDWMAIPLPLFEEMLFAFLAGTEDD